MNLEGWSIDQISKLYLFQIIQSEKAILLFGTESEHQRDDWLMVLRQASNGTSHYLATPKLSLFNTNDPMHLDRKEYDNYNLKIKSDLTEIDFSVKSGYLKKTSSGIMKTTKTRWFRLDGGIDIIIFNSIFCFNLKEN